MEVTGIVARPAMNFYGTGVNNAQVSNSAPCPSGVLFDHASKSFSGRLRVGIGNSRPRCFSALSSSGFADSGHLNYYVSAKKEKDKSCEVKRVKKKLKLIKRLSKDISMVSDMAVDSYNSLMGEVKGKMISEAMEFLLAQLQLMKTEQKELKRKKKAALKASLVRVKAKSDSSSSSSSESSDSECGEVIDMSSLRSSGGSKQLKDNEPEQAVEEATPLDISSSPIEEVNSEEVAGCCTGTTTSSSKSCSDGRSSSVAVRASSEHRVEVCMGGKCKKMGAVALLEEFEKKIGEESAVVVGCKCMGKCKNGPNVRLKNHTDGIQAAERGEGSFRYQTNPLYIGVTVEDVSEVVATLLGKERKDKCMVTPA